MELANALRRSVSPRARITAAAGLVTTLLIVTCAHAASAAPYGCTGAGTGVVSFKGGNVLSTRPASYTYTNLDTLCTLPDRTIHSGTQVGSGIGSFNCSRLGGSFNGSFTEHWDNGKTSTGTYSEHVVGGIDRTFGVITGGEFAGMRSVYVGLDGPTNPLGCLAKSGPLFGAFAGQTLFGNPTS